MNLATNHISRVGLCLLAALSCASLHADNFSVAISPIAPNSGSGCSGEVSTGNRIAFCNMQGSTNPYSAAGISLQRTSSGVNTETFLLGWSVSGTGQYKFSYSLSLTGFKAGTYQVAAPSGRYLIGTQNGYFNFNYSWTSGNANAGGYIAISPAVATANLLSSDYSTEGTWSPKYGSAGYVIAGDASKLPAFATLAISGAALNVWENPSYDYRALQVAAGSTDRIAAEWYSASSVCLNVSLVDGNSHNVSVYLLDWDTTNRNETVTVTDALSGQILDRESLNSFHFGRYFTWQMQGNLNITISNNGGVNATVSALFFE